MTKEKVNDVPDYAKDSNYWVVRECDGEYWFWGAWNDRERADHIARVIGGIVVENEMGE